jgi:hypothetical protein
MMETENRPISERELELLGKLRNIPYGSVTIFMHAGKPVRIERIVESQKLDSVDSK